MSRMGVCWCAWAVLASLHLAVVLADIHINPADPTTPTDSFNVDEFEVARGKAKKKKLKFLIPILLGIAIVKSVLIPLALKAVAFVSGKAFLLSALSLILSSILGLKRFAQGGWDRMAMMGPMRDRGDATESSYLPIPTDGMYHKINEHYWARQLQDQNQNRSRARVEDRSMKN